MRQPPAEISGTPTSRCYVRQPPQVRREVAPPALPDELQEAPTQEGLPTRLPDTYAPLPTPDLLRRLQGGAAFRQRKGKPKLTLQCSRELLPCSEPTRSNNSSNTPWPTTGRNTTWSSARTTAARSAAPKTGASGRQSSRRPASVTDASTMPAHCGHAPHRARRPHPRRPRGPGPRESHDHRAVHPRRLTTGPRRQRAHRLVPLGDRMRPGMRPQDRTPSPVIESPERVQVERRLGDLNPGWTVSPNRISS
jgi:hypothetical protein